ncbi:MAG: PKD domain-containing protein [Halapricum sp.]
MSLDYHNPASSERPSRPAARAQSEVVGIALLVGVVAVLMLIVGGVVVGNVTDRASNEPLVELNVSMSPHNLTLTHGGGETLHTADVTVIVRQNGAEWTYDFGSFREIHGTDSSRFAPGERWQHGHSLAPGLARVLVIHDPSNSVVYDDVVPVPAETNTAPVSRFGYTPTSPGTGQQVTFDAGNATDSDGVITSYAWDFDGDGTTDTTGQTVTHTYSTPAAYNVTLTVTDNAGATNATNRTVHVNSPPSAQLSASCSGRTCSFDASASSDDGTIANYTWDFADGNTTTDGATIEHTYASSGKFNVTVTVTDTMGYTDTETVATTVTDDTSPTAEAGPDRTVDEDTSVTFDGTGSSDNVGIDTYSWTFGDGSTATGPTPTHTYADPGTYTVMLTVSDAAGNTDTDSLTVTVRDATPPSITNATLSDGDGNNLVTSGDTVTISASVSDATAGVSTVTADASALDAGTVPLSDDNGDGTYTGTTNVGSSPTEGQQSVAITATDDVGNANTSTTNTIVVDTTSPQIQTFNVTDRSQVIYFFWLEQYEITWNTDDARLNSTMVYVNRSGTNQATYSSKNDTRIYQQLTFNYNRTYTIKIVAVDDAGNRACRVVHDGADGTGPTNTQYASC